MTAYILLISAYFISIIDSPLVCEKCDEQILVETQLNLKGLSIENIDRFFCTLGDECDDSIEFLEFSNRLVFQVVDAQPEFSLQVINRLAMDSRKLILDKLSEPTEIVHVKTTFVKVSSVIGYDSIKKQVLTALQLAIDKNKVK